MGNDSYSVKLTASATTTLGAVFLYSINLNKVLGGTVTVNEGVANKGIIAASTLAGPHHVVPNGVRYTNLAIALSSTDDVTVFIRQIS